MNNQIQLVLKSSTAEMSLNNHELGIYLTPELDGLVGLPEIRTTSGVNSGYDGGWTSAQNYDARSITIRGVIANTDVATVEHLRKQLVSLAGQGKSEELTLDLVTEAGNAYTLQVRTIALEMAMQSVLSKQEFMLQLRADDPLIYDAGESAHEATLQVAKATGGFTIDFELPLAITGGSEESVVNNDGLEEVPTIVKMYGALHNPKIINQTNNEQMQIMTDLGYAEGAWHTPSEASEGTTISLANTPDSAPFSDVQLKGDAYQNGTPTPDAPVPVQTVTGENIVKVSDGQNEQSYEVNLGKNLFDKDNSAQILNNIYIHAQGMGTNNGFATVYIPCDEGAVYTISKVLTSRFSVGTTAVVPAIGVIVSSIVTDNSATKMTYTTGAGSRYLVVQVRSASDTLTTTEIAATIQIEKGSQATSYAAYFTPIELCKITDTTYQDYIYKSGGDWYIHKTTGKITFNGTENWTYDDPLPTIRRFISPAISDARNTASRIDIYSNYFEYRSSGQDLGTGFLYSAKAYLYYGDTNTTVDDFKIWLSSHNTDFYYKLSTPTDTEITNEALIAQLDDLLNLSRTYQGQTNLSTTYISGNMPAILNVSYYTEKDPDTRDELIIDSRLHTVTLNGLDIYHLIGEGSEFLMLEPGENRLSLQSDITGDNGYAVVSYKQGYLSI